MGRGEAVVGGLFDDLDEVHSGRRGASDLVAAARERVDAQEADLRAWVELSETAPQTAAELDARGVTLPLRGAVVGVKDIIDVAGLPTRCGSPATTSPNPAVTSATIVRRLEALGAVCLGKTETTEYGYFAPAPTVNPVAPERTPGGSSSGSAAAVAAGMVPLALGTQTAGSTTRPASYCGVVGMVLAHGTVDLHGITGLSPSLDSLGLLTRTVADVAHVHQLLTRSSSVALLPDRIPIHVWRGHDLAVGASMSAAVEAAAAGLSDAGHPVDELEWDDHVFTLLRDHPVIMAREAAVCRGGLLDRREDISSQLAQLLEQGLATGEEAYHQALVRCATSRTRLEQFLDGTGGVIIGPAAQGPAPERSTGTGSPELSRPWQAMGLPVVTVPGARTAEGLPLGIQVMGVPGHEVRVFAVAQALERVLGQDQTTSPTARV
ncbi:amidase [Janibacter terrae]|uniref:amidase n=1 Tax=Janibacter terrae TaxID=103817 RepID=UPI0031F83D2B